ncbi:hypothetical protein [Thermomonas sp.]|uniref:hypothetical protein n=1 Tax=Thermomonas sp. TaxID=1971895 RepID=UPI0024886651|nr:hypothetical protein [Thermomonas sp.]MDI1251950.1 hypothetical protein [Thermomonas sp.]
MQANRSPATRNFTVTPPPTYAIAFLVLIGGVVPLAALGFMLWSGNPPLDRLTQVSPALGIIPVVLALLFFAMKRRSVTLVGHVLDVRAALFRERTPIADIDLDHARLVDLAERMDLRPAVKTMGMSLPGFHAGHFRLRGKLVKAFCLITDRQRVLWLPLHNGTDQLLLSVERPQALLDALRAAMDGRAGRA